MGVWILEVSQHQRVFLQVPLLTTRSHYRYEMAIGTVYRIIL